MFKFSELSISRERKVIKAHNINQYYHIGIFSYGNNILRGSCYLEFKYNNTHTPYEQKFKNTGNGRGRMFKTYPIPASMVMSLANTSENNVVKQKFSNL